MCHHWDYDHAYERADEREAEDDPERARIELAMEDDAESVAEERAEREDDPLADVPFADD